MYLIADSFHQQRAFLVPFLVLFICHSIIDRVFVFRRQHCSCHLISYLLSLPSLSSLSSLLTTTCEFIMAEYSNWSSSYSGGGGSPKRGRAMMTYDHTAGDDDHCCCDCCCHCEEHHDHQEQHHEEHHEAFDEGGRRKHHQGFDHCVIL